ncbi:MAG: molybdopterin biosynthesis protein [Firmicutes bacterium]|nr:molybdopterin biosynthesis protein [Bacillota bacterium]
MGKRNLYLDTVPVEEAIRRYMEALEGLCEPQYETIPVKDALHRITKEAIYAKVSSPLFNASAMDGIAVIASRTEGAMQTAPLVLTEGEDFVVVDTGDPVHAPYDAVIMAEDVVELEPEDPAAAPAEADALIQPDAPARSGAPTRPDAPARVRITASAAPWQHIRPVGEDIVAGEMILPGKHRIQAIDIGVLLSAGITEIRVIRRPKVAVFPTGDEIVEPEELNGASPDTDTLIAGGAIIESNSRMFENMVTEAGGIGCRYPVLKDSYEVIRDAVRQAVKDHDMVIVNAGSSAGRDDYTVHVLRELGKVIVHGVAIKPGKPVILAIAEGKPVIGLPGYPVSAYIGFDTFVRPLIERMAGRQMAGRPAAGEMAARSLTEKAAASAAEAADRSSDDAAIDAVISRRLVSSLKHREYVRVKVGKVGGRFVAAPLARGAGAAMSLVRADGFCVIPQESEGVEAGEPVRIRLYRNLKEVERTAVVIGSHDLILDVMADLMPNLYPGTFLSSTHVGSMGGLMALKRGECHIAPTHLLDEETGTYNLPILRKQFGSGIILVKGVGRTQGIMVKKGNPLGIRGIEDLAARAGGSGQDQPLRFINRQRGAGTRVLFDYRLKQLGIAPEQINGYEREATTHMAVAAAVAGDSCDAGMGILSAAKAMDLDFIPIADEEYDFAIPEEYLQLPHVQAFLEVLGSDAFRARVQRLGGYTFERTGKQIRL